VKATGEIGLIKLFTVMGFRGGTRMEMSCGSSALKLLNNAYEQNRQVSQAFSAKIEETGAAARRMNEVEAALKYRVTGLEKRIFSGIAASYAGKGDVVHFEEGLDNNAVRDLADAIAETCSGTAAGTTTCCCSAACTAAHCRATAYCAEHSRRATSKDVGWID
jgi:alanyl-tRNA synthetase